MQAAPLRFLNAAAWPLTVWTSLSRFKDHPADDFVERTFPIAATAIGFWVCLAVLIYFNLNGAGGGGVITDEAGDVIRYARRSGAFSDVLAWFTPALYVVGLWLFTAREERFGR